MPRTIKASDQAAAQAAIGAQAAGLDFPSDEDLGIGAEETPAGQFDALLNHPDFAKVLDAAVSARMRQMGAQPEEPSSQAAFREFLAKFERIVETRDEQRPGYNKPLTANEVEARKQGRAEMFGLLRQFKAENKWPQYLLNDEANPFYGPGPNGDVLYEPGQEIYTRLPPAEGFVPLNEEAQLVYQAYKKWVGEVVSVDDLRADAAAAALGVSGPQMTQVVPAAEPEVRLVDKPARSVAPKRILGTLTPELAGKGAPRQAGVAQQPTGPIFVDG